LVWVSEKPEFGPYAGRVIASYYEPTPLLAVGPVLSVGAYLLTRKPKSVIGLVGSAADLFPIERRLLFYDDFAYPDGSKGEPFWKSSPINDTYGHRLSTDTWTVKAGRMLVGKPGSYEVGALLTGVSAREFKAEVEVELLDYDVKVSNYSSIVYAYRDPDNYRTFQAHWYTNGKVYVIIGKVAGGKGYAAPPWPGLDTGIRFTKGTKVKIVGEVRGSIHTLTATIEGKPFTVQVTDAAEEGLLGLGTHRTFSQAYDNFKIHP